MIVIKRVPNMTREEILSIICCDSGSEVGNYKLMTSILWIKCLLQGKSPFERLRKEGIDEIIIYGITELGEMLVQESLSEGYKVTGITDRRIAKGKYVFENIPILTTDELQKYKEVPIVVTAVMFWDEIKRELNEKGHDKVIALWELM